jgi:hypothetical protein
MKKGKKAILDAIGACMNAHGWPPQKLPGSPVSAWARDTLVTPYFACFDVAPRPFGSYIVEGLIGVVHRGFEEAWLNDRSREPKSAGFAFGLHLANFRELNGKCYVPIDAPFTSEVDEFCQIVANILAKFPAGEQQLLDAFGTGELHGFPIRAFAVFSHRKKFDAMRLYMQGSTGPS